MSRWTLAIDFGTTYTTAAARIGDRPEIIEIDGDRRVPSIVALDQSGALIVGKAAENEAASSPANAIREPKRRLGEPAPVILGGRPFPITTLVAGILAYVYERAVEYVGSPPSELRLTHPATWRRPRVRALGAAAAAAGLPEPMFIPEPVAAAISYTVEGDHIDANDFVAVYDLGGGTFDTAVLRRDEAGGFVVEGRPGGDARMGGEYFDELLAEHLGRQLPAADWEALQASDELEWRQAAAAFHGAVRRAKEALSLQPQSELLVPLPAGLRRMRVTRTEFEELIRPHLAEATELLATTITDAGLEARQLATIYLVGGASRTPLVGALLGEAFPGVTVSRRGDPKMVVALGATYPGDLGSTVLSLTPTPVDSLAAAGAAPRPPPDETYLDPRTPLVSPPPPPPARPDRRPTRAIVAAAVLALILAGGVLGANLLGEMGGSGTASSSLGGGSNAVASGPTALPSDSPAPPLGGTIAILGDVSDAVTTKADVTVSFESQPSASSRITLYAVSNTSSFETAQVFLYSNSVSSFRWTLDLGDRKASERPVYVWFQDENGLWSATPIQASITFDNRPVVRKGVVIDTRGKLCADFRKKSDVFVRLIPTVATDADGAQTLLIKKIWDPSNGHEYLSSSDGQSVVFGKETRKGSFEYEIRLSITVVDDHGLTTSGRFTFKAGPCT